MFFLLFNCLLSLSCKSNNCEFGCVDDSVVENLLILSSLKEQGDRIDFPLPEVLQITVEKEITFSSRPSSYLGFPNQGILYEFTLSDLFQERIVEEIEQSQNIQDAFGTSHVFLDSSAQNDVLDPQNNSDDPYYDWLVVGSPNVDIDFFDEGTVSIFYNGVLRNSIDGIQAGKPIGRELTTCPDWDGDSVDELIIGNSHSTTEHLEVGSLYVLPSSSYSQNLSTIDKLYTIDGKQRAERFGFSVDCARVKYATEDPTSNNVQLLIGSPFASNEFATQGKIGVYLPNGTQDGSLFELWGLEKDSWLGWTVAFGDINGDGFTEIYAGAPGENDNTGSIYVWDSSLYISNYPTLRVLPAINTVRYGDNFIIEDINSDGFDDIIIGSQFIEGRNLRGRVEVIYGQDLSIIEALSIVQRRSKTWTFDEKENSFGRKLGVISVGEQKFLGTTTVVSE